MKGRAANASRMATSSRSRARTASFLLKRTAMATHRARPGVESAKAAGLRYVDDARFRASGASDGSRFRYVAPAGRTISNRAERERIRSLVIPPAWTDVWICPDPRGHLQATGRDARGRKQYRYHPRWREVREKGSTDG